MAVDTVVGCVEFAFEEPCIVAIGEGTAVYGLEVFGPCEEIASESAPESVGLGYGFFVEGFVFFEVCRKM